MELYITNEEGTFSQVNSTLTNEIHPMKLTNRELTILKQLSEGKTYQTIADELFISIETVRKHAHNIYKSLSVKNKIQAINKYNKLIEKGK